MGEIDYDASEPALIQRIGEYAAQVMATMHRGTAAIGLLLANAGPEIETRSLSADVVTDLGFLLAELADLAAQCDLRPADRRHRRAGLSAGNTVAGRQAGSCPCPDPPCAALLLPQG